MNIWVGIPTGERTNQAVEVATAWLQSGVNVAIITWDEKTQNAFLTSKKRFLRKPLSIPTVHHLSKVKSRRPFGVLQNRMASMIDWDVWICGADDLWPYSDPYLIEVLAEKYPDKMIWAMDGCLNKQPTHPIITRQWYEDHDREIFNELYLHNFVDTDLFVRCSLDDSVIKCFDVKFDHRHPIKTKKGTDSIYRAGAKHYHTDKSFFDMKWKNKISAGLPSIQTVRIDHEVQEA